MPAKDLFREDAYLKSCTATVTGHGDGCFFADQTVFYALGGGQPGDTGTVRSADQTFDITDTRYSDGDIGHYVGDGGELPPVGTELEMTIDWDRRYRHMRMHTAMHLLGSILKYDVTGGNISVEKSRLDFNMEDTVDKEAVSRALAELIAANYRYPAAGSASRNWMKIRSLCAPCPCNHHAARARFVSLK